MSPRERVFIYAKFDHLTLCQLASDLRGGLSCSCDLSQNPRGGGFNWVIFITFTDGVEWVLRVPRTGLEYLSDTIIASLLTSEAATLKYIKTHTTLPVPDVFSYGQPYEGQSGSLFEEDGQFCIRTCLSRGLQASQRDLLDDIPQGPFTTEKDYYEAHIAAFREHVQYLPLETHCFFAPLPAEDEYPAYTDRVKAVDHWNNFVAAQNKIDGSYNRTDLVIASDALPYMIKKWTTDLPKEFPHHDKNRFALQHPDLNVNNLFFDQDLNITCIIDWQFCSAVPLPILLTAPGQPNSRYKLPPSLISAFESGFRHALHQNPSPSPLETSKHLHRVLNTSGPISLFTRFVTLDCLNDYHVFHDLWTHTKPPHENLLSYFRAAHQSEKYIAHRAEYEAENPDPTAPDLAKYEKNHGLRDGKVDTTVARKLTLVSEWSERYRTEDGKGIRRAGDVFVADARLWKWVGACLEEMMKEGAS
ncbi:MAG: hypothetical protein L6R36_005624 [Xanthoria steineri]|nr:MAG: hypothetical protein L6R36_005624 [Xanthoria steineri]